MKGLIKILVAIVLGLFLVVPAFAIPSLDFGTGIAGIGGVIILYSDGSMAGVGIPLGSMTVAGAPSNNGVYDLSGLATSSNQDANGNASLDFATGGLAGTNFISVTGDVGGLNIPQSILLSGTISNFNVFYNGTVLSISEAVGADYKNPALLAALGILDTTSPFGASLGFR